MDSLDRCMAAVLDEEVEGHGAGFRALGAEAMADRLLGILGHQALQLGFGLLVGEFRPGVGAAHIDNSDRLDAGFRRLDPEQARGLAVLHAPPEFPLGRDDKMLVKRIRMGGDLYPFSAAGDQRRPEKPRPTCCAVPDQVPLE
jgi:hypothetical protein